MNLLGLALEVHRLAAASQTHPHAIRAEYDEHLAAGCTEAEALGYVRKKFGDLAEHKKRIAKGTP